MAQALFSYVPATASLMRRDGITFVISNQDDGDAAAALAAMLAQVRTLHDVPDNYFVLDADLGVPAAGGPLKDDNDTRIITPGHEAFFVDVQGP